MARKTARDLMTLAKGLTAASIPLGAVVMSAAVYAKLEREMFYGGLTYCGHPLSCAAGVAAVDAYRDEKLIERSKRLGAQMLAELQRLATRHPVIGDVRGGRGLFAVARARRRPHDQGADRALARAERSHEGDARRSATEGISFGSRGNLLILAPPLVITEAELAQALGVLDRLLTRHFLRP